MSTTLPPDILTLKDLMGYWGATTLQEMFVRAANRDRPYFITFKGQHIGEEPINVDSNDIEVKPEVFTLKEVTIGVAVENSEDRIERTFTIPTTTSILNEEIAEMEREGCLAYYKANLSPLMFLVAEVEKLLDLFQHKDHEYSTISKFKQTNKGTLELLLSSLEYAYSAMGEKEIEQLESMREGK